MLPHDCVGIHPRHDLHIDDDDYFCPNELLTLSRNKGTVVESLRPWVEGKSAQA
jgi:hypothetical protein